MAEPSAEPVTYAGYLRLDQLLSAQQPRSAEHDEMLFIVIHQIYELWFKQLLHEFAKLQSELESGETTHAMRTLRRTLAILKIVVTQLDVLETMTPTQFTRFRDALGTSSGFESAQFRELEAVLGRRDRMMLAQYPADSPERARIVAAMSRVSLFDLDEGMQEWRYHHIKMVERTIGARRGTGGSAGATYLRTTLGTPTFPDLWAMRSLG
jgi:tryptophan 2,3-dioxygenase